MLPIGAKNILLDYSMFDSGGVETKTFIFATADSVHYAEWDLVQASIPYPELITQAIKAGERYISVRHLGLMYSGDLVLEIQWD